MLPIIGITCSTQVSSRNPWSPLSPNRSQDMVFRGYVEAVAWAGGVPVLVPLIHEDALLERLLHTLDGLLLTGGADINPLCFRCDPHPHLGTLDPDKDRLEMRLTDLALSRNLPLLGICRGHQVLNVVGGGTLYQDLSSEFGAPVLKHSQRAPIETLTHAVTLEKHTVLHAVMAEDKLMVNSHHHQAVKDLAPEFRVAAVAPDGVIEGLEHLSKPFVVGVQWHPEGFFRNNVHAQHLFQAFIRACTT